MQTHTRFDGEEQQDLGDCGLCVDPEYNVLWSYSSHSGKVACFNPIAADIDGECENKSYCLVLRRYSWKSLMV